MRLSGLPTLRFSLTEKLILFVSAFILLAGIVLPYINLSLFNSYVQEDGPVEWITVAGLLTSAFICFYRFAKLVRRKSAWFLFVTLLLGLFLLFVAGEEVSWGQRIFSVATPEFFQKHNSQQETNLHNLVVGGVKINKLVFSILLIAALGVFFLVLPWLYQKSNPVRRFLDRFGVPVPQRYQVFSILLLFGLTSLIQIPDFKNWELLECCAVQLFFLVVVYPRNREIFSTPEK